MRRDGERLAAETERPRTGLAAVVLAAGRGKRFPGVPSKVLVELGGRALVEHVLDTLAAVQPARAIVVVGHGRDAVMARLEARPVEFADQGEPRGTGHAVLAAGPALAGFHGPLLVLNGDVPLVREATLTALVEAVARDGASASVLTAVIDQPGAYGRVVRRGDGSVAAIIEAADADPGTLAIHEINVGAYAFRAPEVFDILGGLRPDNAQQEIYLTDVVRALVARGERVAGIRVADPLEAAGVNTPAELEALEQSSASRQGGPTRR